LKKERMVICNEEDANGRATVTTDEERVLQSTPCPKNGPPKQNAVTYTVYNTIQRNLNSII